MHPDRDFDELATPPRHALALRQDLALDTLVTAMADGDELVSKVAGKALLIAPGNDIETIQYRQQIIADVLKHPETIREIYGLAVDALEQKRKNYWSFLGRHPSSTLRGANEVLRIFIGVLEKLKSIADAQGQRFASPGLSKLFATLRSEFGEAYVSQVRLHLDALRFDKGLMMSAVPGAGNAGVQPMLHHLPKTKWLKRLIGNRQEEYTFYVHPQDVAGAQALGEIRDQGLLPVATALLQSMDHIVRFFERLRTELAFYIGCANLHERLDSIGTHVCLPQPSVTGSRRFSARSLYDPCLALNLQRPPVGNMLDADGSNLVVITGANQGGKSSLLRAIGLAQLMMQAGMFVAAQAFDAELCGGVFTHFRREEDASMKHGKLEEELARMSDIVDWLAADTMMLFNESFTSTNEREGSQIGRQIIDALLERRIKVCFVTHLYELAHGLFTRKMADATFLRAERNEDGTRTFRLVAGEPLQTSYGEDLYREIFSDGRVAPPD